MSGGGAGYSNRSAVTGEIREARHAGANDATNAATSKVTTLTAKTGQSRALTPNKCVST